MNNPMYYLLAWLAPDRCLICGLEGNLLCESCRAGLPAIGPGCFYCGEYAGLTDSPNSTCLGCLPKHSLDAVVARTFYRNEIAKQLLKKLKFNHSCAAATVIAAELVSALPWLGPNTLIVPVPTANKRIRQRGYDQAVLIARSIAKQSKLPYSSVLARTGSSEQKLLSRKERAVQAAKAFRLKQGSEVSGKTIILIDDVITTGATLEAAARLLKKYGAEKIAAMVFAAA